MRQRRDFLPVEQNLQNYADETRYTASGDYQYGSEAFSRQPFLYGNEA